MAQKARKEMQLGKKGLTQEFLAQIKHSFDDSQTKNMKVHVLRSARESKKDVQLYADKIQQYLGPHFTYRVLGFTIFLKKWRKAPQG